MSDTKTCPFCAEPIKAAAIKCRYCASDLPTSDPKPPYRCPHKVRNHSFLVNDWGSKTILCETCVNTIGQWSGEDPEVMRFNEATQENEWVYDPSETEIAYLVGEEPREGN